MENVTTNKRGLAPSFMARVDACAYIFMADKPEKIKAIMEGRNVSELEAGRIYTIGALKAAKRRGTARSYRGALRLLEAEQVGCRANPLTRTLSADNTARTVSRIRRYQLPGRYTNTKVHKGTGMYTRHGKPVYRYAGTVSRYIRGSTGDSVSMRTNTVDVVRMAWAHMDNQPLTAYAKPERWTVVSTGPQEDKPTRPTTIGKVLGTLYTEWEAREQMADPVYEVCNAVIERNLRVFFAEYTSRLSQTVRMQLADLAAYIRRESNGNVLAVDEAVQALTSAKGKKDPGTSKLAKFVDNLHYRFDHKESVSCPEFIGLLYRYSDICGDTE